MKYQSKLMEQMGGMGAMGDMGGAGSGPDFGSDEEEGSGDEDEVKPAEDKSNNASVSRYLSLLRILGC